MVKRLDTLAAHIETISQNYFASKNCTGPPNESLSSTMNCSRIRWISKRYSHTYSDSVFKSVAKKGYTGIKDIKDISNINVDNQNLSSTDDKNLKSITEEFKAPISMSIGYGSGVFEQSGYHQTNSDNSNLQIDLIHVVDNTREFHGHNLNQFYNHYSMLKYGGVRLVEFFQNLAVGMYFNPFVRLKGNLIKYGIVSTENLLRDLSEWNNLYIAGRLQKPVKFVNMNKSMILLLNEYNLKSAFTVALLLNNKKSLLNQSIFESITLISYLGDPRMRIGGENPNKIKSIVKKQLSNFQTLYHPIKSYFVDNAILIPTPTPNSQFYKINLTAELKKRMVYDLPKYFREQLFYNYYRQKDPIDIDKLVRDRNLHRYIKKTIINIVSGPSLYQSLKGIFTAGILKSLKYMLEKRMKYVRSSK